MAMQEVPKKANYGDEIRVTLDNPGDVIEGFYLGAETFNDGKKDLTKHRFKNEEGKVLSTLGGYDLNDRLPTIPVGSFARITYKGKVKTKKGYMVKDHDIKFESNGL